MKIDRSLQASFRYAIAGLFYALKTERNLKIHFVMTIMILILSFMVKVSVYELLILLLTVTLVIVAELLNTALERAVDLACGSEFHKLAQLAKNVAAAAVLVASINAIIVGAIIFIPKVL